MIKNQIDNFLQKNANKSVVVIQGLGFVGSVMSIVVANSDQNEYAVIGIDLPTRQNIVDELNRGIFPINSTDKKVYEYYELACERGNFLATTDTYAYEKADIVIVDINLDVQKVSSNSRDLLSYDVSLIGFKKAMEDIAKSCKQDVLVLIETTVPPGTCQKIVKPIFDKAFAERGLEPTFSIGHSYERVMPGPGYVDSIKNFYRVYSGIDENSADKVERFLKTVISTDNYPLTRLRNTNATEMSKVLENSFRAMNIAFIQEWTEFAESAGVDLFEVISAIRMRPTHNNIMRPGLGVGGYCLTKDPLLASWASQTLFDSVELSQSEAAVRINDKMPMYTFHRIIDELGRDLSSKKTLILGISYLHNVGDTRYTPVELLYEQLIEANSEITLHDPFVEFWEEKELSTIHDDEISSGNYDIIIIGTPHDIYVKDGILENILNERNGLLVIDPHGCLSYEFIIKFNNKHNFKVIGRGNV